ncbi:histamine H2 receptor-like [Oculina patagonica]
MLSFPECITWLAVGLTECVAIVTLNIITITVFIKNRNLRKRSTYLVINLAVVDMLAGGIATDMLFHFVGSSCDFWQYNRIEGWAASIPSTLFILFPTCSLTNITAISIERLHATLRPFRHRVINKWVYGLILAVVWVTAGLFTIVLLVPPEFISYRFYFYFWNSFIAICLLVMCISYASIVIKVRCGAQPQHHGAASRERKLTMTLLIVTVVSLLLYLPRVIFLFLGYDTDIIYSMPRVTSERLSIIINVLYFANSLVNPILYAIRMPEYRSAVLALFRRRPQQQRQIAVIPLLKM